MHVERIWIVSKEIIFRYIKSFAEFRSDYLY